MTSTSRTVVLGEDPAHHILVNFHSKDPENQQRDSLVATPRVSLFRFDDRPDQLFGRTLWPGLPLAS